MDSGWGVVLGKGLCQSRESRRVLPRHQIQQMDQEANKQWGALRPPNLRLAPTPVLAAVAPDESLISPVSSSSCFASAVWVQIKVRPRSCVCIQQESRWGKSDPWETGLCTGVPVGKDAVDEEALGDQEKESVA